MWDYRRAFALYIGDALYTIFDAEVKIENLSHLSFNNAMYSTDSSSLLSRRTHASTVCCDLAGFNVNGDCCFNKMFLKLLFEL